MFVYYGNSCIYLESGPIILRFADARIFFSCNDDFTLTLTEWRKSRF